MPEISTIGIAFPSAEWMQPKTGTLVSGWVNDRQVLALVAEDDSEQFLVILSGQGAPQLGSITSLDRASEVEGKLVVEPGQGVVPYALPLAGADAETALLVNESKEIGLRIVTPNNGGSPWITLVNLATGRTLTGRRRSLLKGFRINLMIEGRKDAFEIFSVEN